MGVRVNIDWDKARNAVNIGAKRGRHLAGEFVLDESRNTVPFDKGILSQSGFVESTDRKTQVAFDTPYAAKLHEHPEYNFQGNGEGKWLEKTVIRNEVTIIDIIKRELGGEL